METEDAAARLHHLVSSGITPKPVREAKCDRCSLIHLCLPDAPAHSARRFLNHFLFPIAGDRGDTKEPA
jgi:hypothetical protein